jgi:hypothetical protein
MREREEQTWAASSFDEIGIAAAAGHAQQATHPAPCKVEMK